MKCILLSIIGLIIGFILLTKEITILTWQWWGIVGCVIILLITDLSAPDVKKVVRCKDCTEWDKDEGECSHWYGFHENDFCSYGERRDN